MSINHCETGVNEYRHRTPLQMRFNDIDMLGHLNNSIYLTFLDLAKARYFADVNGSDVDISKIGIVIVNININFCAPTFFNEQIEAQTAVTAIGEKSLTMEQRIVRTLDGQVKCSCRTILAGFDPATNTSEPIAEEWIEKLERFEGRSLKKEKAIRE